MHVIVTTHYNGLEHICKIPPGVPAHALVETLQRNLRKLGHPDGVTWQTHDGHIVSALVASTQGSK